MTVKEQELLEQWLDWFEGMARPNLEGEAYDQAVELAAATRRVLYEH